MNLNQFYYFNELAKQHQFSKAAKHLNISQPSLSNSIKSLEKELDCNLIERKNGRIELTKYGQIFLETSESVISVFEKIKRDIKKAKRGENTTIEIGCIPTATNTFLPQVLSLFNKQNSKSIHYIYHPNISDYICLEVYNGNYDIGICESVDKYKNDLTFYSLYTEDTTVTTKKGSLLASKTKFSKNTRTIYLVYNPKLVLSKPVLNLIDFITK